ncbi:hypothetical protein [Tardiphaga sp.]|uniref:hypothetical protein n=1 Tax=Tardiphaga sp. TaxID=1926292 RepID=UPI00352A91F2
MSKPEEKVVSRLPSAAACAEDPTNAVDRLRDDPEIRRALGLVLMQQAMKALEHAGEMKACCHLQAAIDSLLGRYADAIPPNTN